MMVYHMDVVRSKMYWVPDIGIPILCILYRCIVWYVYTIYPVLDVGIQVLGILL